MYMYMPVYGYMLCTVHLHLCDNWARMHMFTHVTCVTCLVYACNISWRAWQYCTCMLLQVCKSVVSPVSRASEGVWGGRGYNSISTAATAEQHWDFRHCRRHHWPHRAVWAPCDVGWVGGREGVRKGGRYVLPDWSHSAFPRDIEWVGIY